MIFGLSPSPSEPHSTGESASLSDVTGNTAIPRAGMFAKVRNRRGIVSTVEPFDGESGRLHLVHLEYKDDQLPHEERLLWELEPHRNLIEPTALPSAAATDPMPADDFDAFLRACRWVAATPYLGLNNRDALERLPISSPFHGVGTWGRP